MTDGYKSTKKMTETIIVRMTPEELAELREYALADDRAVSQVARRAIRAYLYDPGAVLDILTRESLDLHPQKEAGEQA